MRGPCCVSRSPVARQAAPMLRSLQGAGDFRGAGSDPALAHTARSSAPASAELQQVTTTQQLPPDLSERHKAWAAVKSGNTQIVVVINIELR